MRLLLVVNTSASSVTERARVVIHRALSGEHEVTVAETSRPGHATRLAQGAAADQVDVVVALGGDGTVNEAANGLTGTSTALAVLPGGSTNVYARTIGMANDPIVATGQVRAALRRSSIRPVNVGGINGRAFLFHVGLGFDASVVAAVERHATLKRYAGHTVFVMAAVGTWMRRRDRSPVTFEVEADGLAPTPGSFAICLKTDPYTFLGDRPLRVAPGTGLDTPLSMVTFRQLELATLVPAAVAALRGQGLAGRRHIEVAAEVAAVTVRARHPIPYQVDGEYLGRGNYFRLRNDPDALRLVVP